MVKYLIFHIENDMENNYIDLLKYMGIVLTIMFTFIIIIMLLILVYCVVREYLILRIIARHILKNKEKYNKLQVSLSYYFLVKEIPEYIYLREMKTEFKEQKNKKRIKYIKEKYNLSKTEIIKDDEN